LSLTLLFLSRSLTMSLSLHPLSPPLSLSITHTHPLSLSLSLSFSLSLSLKRSLSHTDFTTIVVFLYVSGAQTGLYVPSGVCQRSVGVMMGLCVCVCAVSDVCDDVY